ncbi:hypothetical protein Micbo1qcDRAFT_169461, partial [Microdochium bolleyi]
MLRLARVLYALPSTIPPFAMFFAAIRLALRRSWGTDPGDATTISIALGRSGGKIPISAASTSDPTR